MIILLSNKQHIIFTVCKLNVSFVYCKLIDIQFFYVLPFNISLKTLNCLLRVFFFNLIYVANIVINHLYIYNDITQKQTVGRTETLLSLPDLQIVQLVPTPLFHHKNFYFCLLPTGLPCIVFTVQ